ncbi:MAG: 4'-phosphopantetheinyl transferase family protein [Kofleriaceae bacterium]
MSAPIDVYRIVLDVPHRSGCADRALHAVLARYLDRAAEIVIGPYGKPQLRDDDSVAFNVSHSGSLALVAVSREGPLGVDLEQHRVIRDIDKLAARYFTQVEASLVAADPQVFFRLWARKEAWIKAQGGGLTIALDTVDLSGQTPGWFIADLSIARGYSAAIARPGASAEIRVMDP